jgi:hypothetical protein
MPRPARGCTPDLAHQVVQASHRLRGVFGFLCARVGLVCQLWPTCTRLLHTLTLKAASSLAYLHVGCSVIKESVTHLRSLSQAHSLEWTHLLQTTLGQNIRGAGSSMMSCSHAPPPVSTGGAVRG